MADASLSPEEQKYFDFVNNWHRNTIASNKVAKDAQGRNVTVNAVGLPIGDKIYMVPGYLPETGEILTEDEAYSYWKDKIPQLEKEGQLSGIPNNWMGNDMSQHPANVMARKNHEFMDKETIEEDAIAYDYSKVDK